METETPEELKPEEIVVPAGYPDDAEEDAQILDAAASAGLFLRGVTDGDVADYDMDTAFGLASSAASVPEVLCDLSSYVPDDAASVMDPVMVRDQMMADYFSQDIAAMMAECEANHAEIRRNLQDTRRLNVFKFSHIPSGQAARINFDAEAGDRSPLLSVQERFFFS